MYLVDTNIFLEGLLRQERAAEVESFYAVAEKYDLQIISFDKDFDLTERGRKEPAEVLS